jgi:Immunoglobulin domain
MVAARRRKPEVLGHPAATAVREGDELRLAVAASGDPPLRFKWFRDGEQLQGHASATLCIPSVGLGDAGQYTCQVGSSHRPRFPVVQVLFIKPPVVPTSDSSVHAWSERAPFASKHLHSSKSEGVLRFETAGNGWPDFRQVTSCAGVQRRRRRHVAVRRCGRRGSRARITRHSRWSEVIVFLES